MTNKRQGDDGRREKGRKIDDWRGVGSFGTIGLEIVLSIAFGFFGGKWLDEKFGTAPYLGGIGFVVGLIAAIKALMRAHAEMKAIADKEEREQGNPSPRYNTRGDEWKNDAIEHDPSAPDDASDGDEEDEGEGKGKS